jgi:chemotaxis protein methyltransferase CheR
MTPADAGSAALRRGMMTDDDFRMLAGLLKERVGLVLGADKARLVESRLAPLARRQGLDGLGDLFRALRQRREERLVNDVAEAVAPTDSAFLRDPEVWEALRAKVLPALLAARGGTKRLRFWSAGAAAGQEAYTLAILLAEAGEALTGWRAEILATDLCRDVMEKGKSGLYSQFEVQRGLPIRALMRHFSKAGDLWQISSALRGMVRFERHNLLDDAARLGGADVVLCRYVLSSFDPAARAAVLDRLARLLPPDGYLVLGAGEDPGPRFLSFEGIPAVYTPRA